MSLKTTYKQIFAISAPIMLGSAAQNVVALSDSVFLFHVSEADFAAIGFVGVFYLIIAAIGYGFSRGGQIMIARRMGENAWGKIGRTFYAMTYFELGLAILMFLFMQYGGDYFFSFFVDSPEIKAKSLEYLEYRSYGVFFSYLGVAIIALYTGVARTTFIIVDTIILAVVNIVLNYGLIYGAWGLPEMGIAGAGLASTIAEVVAFVVFVVYMLLDKKARTYQLFRLPSIDFTLIKQIYFLAAPIVAQAIVGLGSWFVFFSIVENLGERELAVTNLVRMVYLILSIPTWGFASGVNTLVSNFIGAQKRQAVFPITLKTSYISLVTTLAISLPVLLFPSQVLFPLLGSGNVQVLGQVEAEVEQPKVEVISLDEASLTKGEEQTELKQANLIKEAQPVFYVLLGILIFFSVGGVFFNGLAATGATTYGLIVQTICVIVYISYIHVVVNILEGGLEWAWAAEIFYWVIVLVISWIYLRTKHWHSLEV
ncbi:MAG: MATE family efflux transporter [Bacteroidota bacterium]